MNLDKFIILGTKFPLFFPKKDDIRSTRVKIFKFFPSVVTLLIIISNIDA